MVGNLQELFIKFQPAQYAIVGFSVGLHMFNAFLYSIVLALVGALGTLHLRTHKPSLALAARWMVNIQPIQCIIYLIQHSLIFAQFASERPLTSYPPAIGILSIVFLILLVSSVLLDAVILLCLFKYRAAIASASSDRSNLELNSAN